jgi:tyrosyl-tRNA synthetase
MSSAFSIEEQVAELTRGACDVIDVAELRAKLERRTPLVVKLGADPTAPDLHLGHAIVLDLMRRFQDLGHRVQFLIGDFTGAIGDPSGRNTMRPQLSPAEIQAAADTYAQQVARILRPEATEIVFNSTWFSKMTVAEFVQLASHWTVQRMFERDDFAKRRDEQKPIGIHEFLYPLVQGYDSVAMRADVELGGADQRFNLLVGRSLQRDFGQEPQVVMMVPLLVGTDGVEKMSKSKGNAIGIAEPPAAQVAKTMQISDETMATWYAMILHRAPSGEARAAKLELSRAIAARYHGEDAANAAIEDYERKARGEVPEKMPEVRMPAGTLTDAVFVAKLQPTKKRAWKAIEDGLIALDGQQIKEPKLELAPGAYVVRSGRHHHVRVIVE